MRGNIQPSLSERWPKLSFVCSSLFLALILTPFVYGYVLYSAVTDEVQCTDDPPLPETWADFRWEISFVFLLCLCCACFFVLLYRVYRLWSLYFRKTREDGRCYLLQSPRG